VLRDAARLAGRDVRRPDLVEEGGLAMVDVAHHGDDGSARLAGFVALVVALAGLLDRFFLGDRDVFDVPTELAGQQLGGVGVERGVDVHARHTE
jgi:hypothetical protein